MKKSTLAVERCKTVSAIQKILGGKWKIEIIYYIAFRDIHRFGEEADGFIIRHDYKEVPPHVEYHLTDLGKSFIPVFEHMKQWGEENLGV